MGTARDRLARAAGAVSLATLCSRVLGLTRDAVRAALLGASALSDALDVAFKVPNLLRDLFAEGAFSGAFVPTLAGVRERKGDAAAFEVLNRVFTTMLIHVGLVVVLLVWGADGVVRLITAERFAQSAEFGLTVLLVRLLAPFLLFVSLAVAAMGALNLFDRFFVPALSPALQNLTLVAGGGLMLAAGIGGAAAAVPWAVLLLIGGLAQFVVQLPALWRLGWRPRLLPDPLARHAETRTILGRMLPVVGGMAATHVCIVINTKLATDVVGGTSNLYYAFRLVHLPVGLVGVAVGTAVLAHASRSHARGDAAAVQRSLQDAIRVTLALSLPAAAGLLVLGEPLARMLYLWGNMEPESARAIGATVRYFSAAVVFYCLVKVTVPVLYAQGRVKVPLAASLVAVAANLAVALGTYQTLESRGLALAVGAGQAANWLVLMAVLRVDLRPLALPVARSVVGAALCGLAAWWVADLLPADRAVGARLLRGLLPVAAGMVAYFGSVWLLGARTLLDRPRNRA
jgi:putative peptidoglycan lipid II flippase